MPGARKASYRSQKDDGGYTNYRDIDTGYARWVR
jgi:hypothetical protein